ncbi:MAG: hypothetical protein K0S46_2371 [Moraxellaceae bacterium]|jgi:hypothetical protein|nr:hypothetical protein [Moraxellaceae bacterium]
MRQLKALFGATLALLLAACSNPQFVLNPFSNPATTQVRQGVGEIADTTLLKPLVWGSFLAPAKGAFFKPVLATDSRNAIVYVYRPQSDWNDAEVQSPGFFLNGRFLSGLKSGSYFWFEIPASSYYFSAKRPLSFFYLTTIFETDVSFEGGKSYFFRYDEERPGPKKVAKGAALLVVGPLQQMPDLQGQIEIAQTRSMGAGSVLLADTQPQWTPFEFYPGAYPVPASRLDVESDLPRVLRSREEEMQAERALQSRDDEEPEQAATAGKSSKRWWNIASWK